MFMSTEITYSMHNILFLFCNKIILLSSISGTPNLIGITGIDGVGWLGKGLSGSAEWLIIPHADAAPQDDTLYDVGGTKNYTKLAFHIWVVCAC